jgi:hypothetical protein
MNNAWQYCENITPTEPEKALAGACLTALLTIDEFRRKGLDPESMDWAAVAAELKSALAVAGHPAGNTPTK